MTTVVADKSSMACDLQFTYGGNIKFKGSTKIIKLNPLVSNEIFGVEKALIGFCGNADQWANVVAWFSKPEGKPPKIKNMELLMLTGNKEIYHASTLDNWLKLEEPFFAIGSGMSFAMAAMESGKTTTQAVKVATRFDVNTGLGVKTYKI